jgi:RNA polymerase sigma factor (sigma-70 family)
VLSASDFEAAVIAHIQVMYRLAASLASPNDAEDVVQDALARAWTKRSQFDSSRGSVRTWLLAIVADHARQRWRRRPHMVDASFLQPTEPENPNSDTRLDARRAVAGLPPRQRTAIVLYHYVDLPVIEVANLMGCSPGTVKSTLRDARRALSTTLGASYARD